MPVGVGALDSRGGRLAFGRNRRAGQVTTPGEEDCESLVDEGLDRVSSFNGSPRGSLF